MNLTTESRGRYVRRALVELAYMFGLPALIVAIWWLCTVDNDDFFAVSPPVLVQAFIEEWLGSRIVTDVLGSLGRLFIGLILALLIGIVLGGLIGSFRRVRYFLEPVFEFFRAIPPPVLIPVLALIMGAGDAMRIVVIVWGCLWPILLNTVEGVRATDPVLQDTCATYRIAGWRRVGDLVLPAAMPQIMAGTRQSLSVGLILVVISEMFAASSGLGYTIIQFQRTFAIPEMWSGIALLGLLGIALSFLFQFIERRVLKWYHGMKEVEGNG